MHSTTVVLPIKVLWPAMHDRDDLIEYNAEEYNTYQRSIVYLLKNYNRLLSLMI